MCQIPETATWPQNVLTGNLYGSYKEVVIEDAGHAPFIEKPEEFNEVLHAHLRGG